MNLVTSGELSRSWPEGGSAEYGDQGCSLNAAIRSG